VYVCTYEGEGLNVGGVHYITLVVCACMLTLIMHRPTLYSRFAFLINANVGISST